MAVLRFSALLAEEPAVVLAPGPAATASGSWRRRRSARTAGLVLLSVAAGYVLHILLTLP